MAPKLWPGTGWCRATLSGGGLPRLGQELALEHHAVAREVGQGEDGQGNGGASQGARGTWGRAGC